MYTQEEVEKLLAGKEAVAVGQKGVAGAFSGTDKIGSSLANFMSKGADSSIQDVRNLMRELLNFDDCPVNDKGEKALLPIHFLSCIRGTQNLDEVIHSSKGMNLVLQSDIKRVAPEKLTAGQWISANARILNKLVTDGKLSATQLKDYLEYTRKVGDLMQLFVVGSVCLLDHHHRLMLHDGDGTRRWYEIDSTLEIAHLKKRDDAVHNSNTLYKPAGVGSGAAHNNAGQPGRRRRLGPCWAFNSAEGCPYSRERCRYEHVETPDRNARSSGSYERAPRFQKALGSAAFC